MASKIFLEKHGDRITLHAPDDSTLDARAAVLDGRRKGGSWTFPTGQEAAVRKLARDLFGTDASEGGPSVTLRVDLSLFGEGSIGSQGEAWLAGRLLARRATHDTRVHLGDGVSLVRGGFGIWGGSRNHPALDARYGTVVDVQGVPRAAADLACSKYPITTAIVLSKEDPVVGAWSKTVVTHQGGSAPAVKPATKPATKPAAAPKAAPTAKAAPKAKPAPKAKVVKAKVVKTKVVKTKVVKAKAKAKATKAKSPKAKTKPAAKPAKVVKAKAKAKPAPKAKVAKSKARKAKARVVAKPAKVVKAKAKGKTKPAAKKATAKAKKVAKTVKAKAPKARSKSKKVKSLAKGKKKKR